MLLITLLGRKRLPHRPECEAAHHASNSNHYNFAAAHSRRSSGASEFLRLVNPWGENVGSWLTCLDRPSFLLARYEDLMSDPMLQLGRIARFLDIEPSAALLATAIERSSAQRMRVLERTQGSQWITTRDKRQDIPFVGAASIGRWKERLSPASIAEIEAAWGPLMVQLGYNLLTARDDNLGVSVPNRATGPWTMGNGGPRAVLSHPAAAS